MLKIMLVDDEPIILDKLSHLLTNVAPDCAIVAKASNGTAALQSAQGLQPQIIFSDIQMPLMNGIELAQALKQSVPEALIILISGYNEFSYAQQAIATGVFRYLLKPIDSDKLATVLAEAREYLTLREEEAAEKKRLQVLIREQLPRLREKFFSDLIKGGLEQGQLREQLDFLELTPACDCFGVIILQMDNFAALHTSSSTKDLHLLKFRLLTLANHALEHLTFCYCFIHRPSEIVIAYGTNDDNEAERLLPRLTELQNRFCAGSGQTFSAGLGRLYPELASLPQSYHEALVALDFKVWTGQNALIPFPDIERSRSGRLIQIPNHDHFNLLLREGDPAKTDLAIDQYFVSLQQSSDYTSKSLLHLAVLDLINQIIRTALEFNGPAEQLFGPDFDPLQAVNACESLPDLACLVKELSRTAVRFIALYKQSMGKNFVEQAKSYLEQNFANPELSLNEVAQHVFVSASYLSHLFKQVTGNTVTEYLNRIRIQTAQKLLKQTTQKIYEIAEQVGFSDSHYFSIVFKKSTGISALEYRDKVKIDTML